MIVGGSKKDVIKNIQKNIQEGNFNAKAETTDPSFTEEEADKLTAHFFAIRKKRLSFFIKQKYAKMFVNGINKKENGDLIIEGIENIKDINTGAIITCNHFNPLDSLAIRQMVKKAFNKDLYIVIQENNLALPGFLSFLTNYLNNIPLRYSTNYIIKKFNPYLKKVLNNKNYVLVYPEEEMWFNYRKPRPPKKGAYKFAAENNVPIISCFTEIIDKAEDDNEEFKKVKYKLHILKPIYPNKELSSKENARIMADIDYKQKVEAYEKAYNKKLDYKFEYSDIAGYKTEKN